MMATLSKSNEQGVKLNRMHLRCGNHEAYARGMSGMHRAASLGQQKAIWEAIVADGMVEWFTRTHNGTCLIAIEVFQDDPEMVLVEMAA